jgi:lipopolysaccharide/colanic/teichoic acid biosynthesis glycosyltransferase
MILLLSSKIISLVILLPLLVKNGLIVSISQPAPFMNKTLRSAVYKKRMTHNKFLKDKGNKNWEAYRKQRNLVTKLKKQSIRTYFYERCVGGPKSTDFLQNHFQFHEILI